MADEDQTTTTQNNPIRIPVVVDADFDPNDLVSAATAQLLAERKDELRSKIVKIFHAADALSRDQRMFQDKADKAGQKLAKKLAQIDKLKAGDWSVLKNDDKEE